MMTTITEIERAEQELAQSQEITPPKEEGWSIKGAAEGDAGKAADIADGIVAKIARWQRALEANRYVAQEKIASTEHWLADQEKRAQDAIGWLEILLHSYYVDFPPVKGKTLSLPSGKLKSTKASVTTDWDDEATRQWVREQGIEAMELWFKPTEPQIDREALNEHIVYNDAGEAVWEPTGEVMEVTRDFEGGQTETVIVKRQVQPPTAEIFTVETFENSPLQEAD